MSNETNDAIARFKSQFHRHERLLHLNNAGQAPISRPAYEILQTWAKRYHEEGAHGVSDLIRQVNEAKVELARFLGCESEEIAFFQSAAGAISQVALGFDLKAGDEVIVWDQEYPSNLYPWRDAADRAGAKLVVAPSGSDLSTPVETLQKLVTSKTRMIATSWVQYRSGAIADLKALTDFTRPKGIFVCADVIQGAGVLPFDFKATGVDAACGGSHKWMTAAHGAGFLVLRGEHRERLRPLMSGAVTYGTPDDKVLLEAKPRIDMLRYEPGGKAFAEIVALGASARLLRETGIDRIAHEAEWLARKLMHGLRELGYTINSPHGAHHRGAIVNFNVGPNSKFKTQAEVETRLSENWVSFGKRPPGIRLSPHAFNTAEDIERLLALL